MAEMGLTFTEQVPIGTYIVDFLMDDGVTIVEAYGWSHEKYNKEHDRVRVRWLKKQGYKVIVLWHHSPHLWWLQLCRGMSLKYSTSEWKKLMSS